MTIYHVTTLKKAKKYKETGYIKKPVRGFENLFSAIKWAFKTGRTIIYQIEKYDTFPLPDHEDEFGKAYWIDEDVKNYTYAFRNKNINEFLNSDFVNGINKNNSKAIQIIFNDVKYLAELEKEFNEESGLLITILDMIREYASENNIKLLGK